MKVSKLEAACRWIALHDGADSGDGVEDVATLPTVALTAAVHRTSPEAIARRVVILRAKQGRLVPLDFDGDDHGRR